MEAIEDIGTFEDIEDYSKIIGKKALILSF
jgi:hypothetical protein